MKLRGDVAAILLTVSGLLGAAVAALWTAYQFGKLGRDLFDGLD